MWQSLVKHHQDSWRLFVLCLDRTAYDIVAKIGPIEIVPVPLEDLENADAELLRVKPSRSKVEYYFTITPCLISYLFKQHFVINQITYLDADLCFYSSPAPLFEEMGDASILVIPHRFPERLRHLEENGLYNVGLLSFRRDVQGLGCVEWWRARCLEWCYDRHEDGKFADQKYLDAWPGLFKSACISTNQGANVAPWNVERNRIEKTGKTVTVDGMPLIFYHFQGYRWLTPRLLDPGLAVYGALCKTTVARAVLLPYAYEVICCAKQIEKVTSVFVVGSGNTRWSQPARYRLLYIVRLALTGYVVLYAGGRLWYLRSRMFSRIISIVDRMKRKATTRNPNDFRI